MGTIILSGLIFIGVGGVIYRYGIKKKSSCDCANTDCPVNRK